MRNKYSFQDKTKKLVLGVGLVVGAFFTGTAGADPAAGGGAQGETYSQQDGYLWYDNASGSATYPGDGSQQFTYNPTGEDVAIVRQSTGKYRVTFSSTSQLKLPSVTAWSPSAGSHCNINQYAYNGGYIEIGCYDSSGNLMDQAFSARWTLTDDDAYSFIYGDATTCCQNNPWGGAITASKTGTGQFRVTVPGGPNFKGGNVQVTAYDNLNQGHQCKVRNWGDLTANVDCRDTSGSYVDPFGFTFLRTGTEDDAFAWVNDETSTTTYNVNSYWSHNPQGTNPTSIKTATGQYEVTFPGLLQSYGGNVQVTAHNSTDSSCAPYYWTAPISRVRCTNSAGVAVDSTFSILWTRFQTCAGLPANVEIGNNLPTSGSDVIVGTSASETINGLGGNDIICGGDGFDTLYGNSGNDTLYGGDGFGNDTSFNDLFGGTGNDYLYGGLVNSLNYLYGQGGSDFIYHGAIAEGGSGGDVLNNFDRSNSSTMKGGGNNDQMYGGQGNDSMNGGPGLDYMDGGPGGDTMAGGNARDTMYGGDGNDTMTGGAANDFMYGNAGDDNISGNQGNDFINGGSHITGDTCDGGGQTTADTYINCETTSGFPAPPAAPPAPLPRSVGRAPLTDDEVKLIDRCNLTVEECLGTATVRR